MLSSTFDLLQWAFKLTTYYKPKLKSSLPKLHLDRSSTEALRPPPLIYCNANRVEVHTLQQSKEPF